MEYSWWHVHFIVFFFFYAMFLPLTLALRVSFDKSAMNYMNFPLYESPSYDFAFSILSFVILHEHSVSWGFLECL